MTTPIKARTFGGWLALILTASLVAVVVVPGAAGAGPVERCFTTAVHRAILDRESSIDEMASWENRLIAGVPKSTLLDEMARSDEAWTRQFELLYRHVLDRSVDPDGRAFWLNRIQSGTSWVGVAASVYGSDEFFRRVGGTDRAFVVQLYEHVLDRSGDEKGIGHWLPLVPKLGRAGVAAQFLHTLESRQLRLEVIVQRVLGRTSATDYENQGWLWDRLLTTSDLRMAATFATSGEFQGRAMESCS